MSDQSPRTIERGYQVFLSLPEHRAEFETAGIPVAGTLDELLAQGDVVAAAQPCRHIWVASAASITLWPTLWEVP